MATDALPQLVPVLAAAASTVVVSTLAHASLHPRSQLFGPVICRAPGVHGNQVALTFDDGPWPDSTDRILDSLQKAGATATFFVIGAYAKRQARLLRRIHEAGHLLGNHSYDHHRTGLFHGKYYWLDQLRRTSDVIAEVTGTPPAFFRPPMGFKSPPLVRAARHLGLSLVAWSRRARDGIQTTPGRILSALAPIQAGEIALLHDGRDPPSDRDVLATAAAIPAVLAQLDTKGLVSVRLDQLLAAARLTDRSAH